MNPAFMVPIAFLYMLIEAPIFMVGLMILAWLYERYIDDLGFFEIFRKEETVEPYPERCKQITLAGNRCKHHRSRDSEKGYCAFHENKSR